MLFIYPDNFLKPRLPDPAYAAEQETVRALDQQWALMSFATLVSGGNAAKAVERIAPRDLPVSAVYRGWMLTPDHYAALYHVLHEHGVNLINTPDAYRYMHYLPESYPDIAPHTARSVWLPSEGGLNVDQIMPILSPFGDAPIVVKDYVKSQKHYWNEAFYIPSASARDQVQRVVNRFLELQGDDLNKGLVFREFVDLETIGDHSQSGMPVVREFRMFVLSGQVIYTSEYWQDGDYQGEPLPAGIFSDVIRQLALHSHFLRWM